ncbi:MAG: hypothetical protein PQJ59_15140 [Spirochaetales bacterium]|nr:hypothetical protein [Spirochaetales bacterium]
MLLAPVFSQVQDESGESLIFFAAEELAAGRLTSALEAYERATLVSDGSSSHFCRLKILQIQFELGRFSELSLLASQLANENVEDHILGDVLLIQIHSLIKEGRKEEALLIMEEKSLFLSSYPPWAMGLSDAYEQLDMIPEAGRLQWIIKRDFPSSPEAMVLTGRGERRLKPNDLILP